MKLGTLLATGVVALSPFVVAGGSSAAASGDKVSICHWAEGRGYVLISVSARAADHHASHHDRDVRAVGDDCDPVPVLAKAVGTASGGDEFLIAQLEDTDRSGSVTVGDIVRSHRHPVAFDGSGLVTSGQFAVTQHPVSIVHMSTSTVVIVGSGTATFTFSDNDAMEGFTEMFPDGAATQFVDMVGGGSGFGLIDSILLSADSPSTPGGISGGSGHASSEKVVQSDDPWLEVEISL